METLKPLDELLLEHPFFAGMEEGPRKFIAGCGRNETTCSAKATPPIVSS